MGRVGRWVLSSPGPFFFPATFSQSLGFGPECVLQFLFEIGPFRPAMDGKLRFTKWRKARHRLYAIIAELHRSGHRIAQAHFPRLIFHPARALPTAAKGPALSSTRVK